MCRLICSSYTSGWVLLALAHFYSSTSSAEYSGHEQLRAVVLINVSYGTAGNILYFINCSTTRKELCCGHFSVWTLQLSVVQVQQCYRTLRYWDTDAVHGSRTCSSSSGDSRRDWSDVRIHRWGGLCNQVVDMVCHVSFQSLSPSQHRSTSV